MIAAKGIEIGFKRLRGRVLRLPVCGHKAPVHDALQDRDVDHYQIITVCPKCVLPNGKRKGFCGYIERENDGVKLCDWQLFEATSGRYEYGGKGKEVIL
tara:strand:+ start:1024 stop:1320 length:297 start_codon:yes stop_codon:yes gene_type:complete